MATEKPNAEEFCVVFSTAPDAASAERVARAVVEARLAACVNIVPGLRSLYPFKGDLHDDPELMLVMKTRRALLGELNRVVLSAHPYEVPELIALPLLYADAAYLAWLEAETRV